LDCGLGEFICNLFAVLYGPGHDADVPKLNKRSEFNAAPLDEDCGKLLIYQPEFNPEELLLSKVRQPTPTVELIVHNEVGRVETQLKANPGTEFSLGFKPRKAIAATPDGSVNDTNLVIAGTPNPVDGETVEVISISFTYNWTNVVSIVNCPFVFENNARQFFSSESESNHVFFQEHKTYTTSNNSR